MKFNNTYIVKDRVHAASSVIVEICLQVQKRIILSANASRREHLHTTVARLRHFHGAFILLTTGGQSLYVSALITSSHAIVLQYVMHITFVISLDDDVVHAFEVDNHLLVIISKDLAWGQIILHKLLLVLHRSGGHPAHCHLINILLEKCSGAPF